jgi:hypothetical protein
MVGRAVAMRECVFQSLQWHAIHISFLKCQRSKVAGGQHVHVRCCVYSQGPVTLYTVYYYIDCVCSNVGIVGGVEK